MQPQLLARWSRREQGVALTLDSSTTVQNLIGTLMQSFKFALISLRARWAGAVFALVASLSTFAAVFAIFASASGELDPMLAKVKAGPAASAVAVKAPAQRARG